jgi:hypothetical protein
MKIQEQKLLAKLEVATMILRCEIQSVNFGRGEISNALHLIELITNQTRVGRYSRAELNLELLSDRLEKRNLTNIKVYT